MIWLGVPFDPGRIDWPLLIVTLTLGVGAIIAIGLLLAGICLQTRQESWSYPEAMAGALFLVSGVVFPLSVLPTPVQALGLITPLTWWVEGVRHAVFPDGPSSIGGPGSFWTSRHRNRGARRRDDHPRLAGDRGAGYTRGHGGLPCERAPRQGSRAA